MGNFRSFQHQKPGPSPASPSSFVRPARLSISPPEHYTRTFSDEAQQTDHVIQRKRSVAAESTHAKKRPSLEWNFAHNMEFCSYPSPS